MLNSQACTASYSPQGAFHARSYTSPAQRPIPNSPRHSPRLQPKSSVTSAQRPPPSPSPQVLKPASPLVQRQEQTVDVGTQYTPPGLPPTSRTLAQSVPAASSPPLQGRGKRRSTSRSPTRPSAEQPPEPDPRTGFQYSRPSQSSTNIYRATPSSTTLSSTSTESSSPKKRAKQQGSVSKEMPIAYETCDVNDLVTLISDMLMELVRFNDEIPLKDGQLTRFHSRAPPGISVRDYLLRLTTHATLSPPLLLSMVYYIDRLCALYPAFTISSLTVHRFLIAAATVAAKGLSDSFWTNTTYARVGGVSVRELALLELELLRRVDWTIVPKPEVLVDYYRSLVDRSEGFVLEAVKEAKTEVENGADQDEGMLDVSAG